MPQLMSQVNVLPVDVTQSTELKGENSFKGSRGNEGKNQGDSFSALVDRHLSSDKSGNESQKTAKNGNNAPSSETKARINDKLERHESNEKRVNVDTSKDANVDEKVASTAEQKQLDESERSEQLTTDQAKETKETITQTEVKPSVDELDDTSEAAIGKLTLPEEFLSFVASSKQALSTDAANKEKVNPDGNSGAKSTLSENDDTIIDDETVTRQSKKLGDLAGEVAKQGQISKAEQTDAAIKNAAAIEALHKGKTLPNEALAKSITDAIRKEQLSSAQSGNQTANINSETIDEAIATESEGELTQAVKDQLSKNAPQNLSAKAESKPISDDVAQAQKLQTIALNNQAADEAVLSESSELSSNERNQLAANAGLNENSFNKNNEANKSNNSVSMKGEQLSLNGKNTANESDLLTGQLNPESENGGEGDKVEQVFASVKSVSAEQSAQIKGAQRDRFSATPQDKNVGSELSQSASQSSADTDHEQLTEEQINQQMFAHKSAESADDSNAKSSSFGALSDKVMASIPQNQTASGAALQSQTNAISMTESSQVIIEEMTNNLVSDNVTQAKNNAATLNETISIFRKDFAEAVKDKVMVLISQKLQQFDIQLDPPELGNVHVRVNLQNEQAVVNFTVQNQQAKEAFEENLGKLKEMLSEKGVDVGDANVEQQAQNSEGDESNESQNGLANNKNTTENDDVEQGFTTNLYETSPSGVDYYA